MGEPEENIINTNKKTPLIVNLPDEYKDHFEILNKSQTVTMQSGLVTLLPGQDVGSHNTENYEELIVVLEGNGEVETDSFGRRKISKQQVAYNPPHTQHNVYNNGSKPLRYIYIVAKVQ
jgi:quercetin dioxygenase-like cupin family protein